MHLKGRIKIQVVTMLVDTGNTHNFLDSVVAKRLGCKLQAIKGVDVQVANGDSIPCWELCKRLCWTVQGLTQSIDVLILPLLGCDIVLGVEWLQTLGPILWDFNVLEMEFHIERGGNK